MLGSVPKLFLVMLCGLAIVTPTGLMAQTLPSQELEALQFRHIGVVGNRVASVAGVVGNPLVYYAGAASGGLWKTEDGGINWRAVFDDQRWALERVPRPQLGPVHQL